MKMSARRWLLRKRRYWGTNRPGASLISGARMRSELSFIQLAKDRDSHSRNAGSTPAWQPMSSELSNDGPNFGDEAPEAHFLPPAGQAVGPPPPPIDIDPAGVSFPPADSGQVIPIICDISYDPATQSLNYTRRRLRCHSDGRVYLLPYETSPAAQDCPDGVAAEARPVVPAGPPQREMNQKEIDNQLRAYLRRKDRAAKAERHKKRKGMY